MKAIKVEDVIDELHKNNEVISKALEHITLLEKVIDKLSRENVKLRDLNRRLRDENTELYKLAKYE